MTVLDVKGCRTLCLNSEKGKEEKKGLIMPVIHPFSTALTF